MTVTWFACGAVLGLFLGYVLGRADQKDAAKRGRK